MTNKEELLSDIDLAIGIMQKAKKEIQTANTSTDGTITHAYCGEYSLEKIRRNCTTARELILNVRKGCEW